MFRGLRVEPAMTVFKSGGRSKRRPYEVWYSSQGSRGIAVSAFRQRNHGRWSAVIRRMDAAMTVGMQ